MEQATWGVQAGIVKCSSCVQAGIVKCLSCVQAGIVKSCRKATLLSSVDERRKYSRDN
jgi:hypothetical protein